MKSLFLTIALMLSSSLFAQSKMVTTEGSELHFTCVLNFNPFFIELSSNHQSGKLYLNNRTDHEGRGQSREFITTLSLASKRQTDVFKFLVFKSSKKIKDFRTLSLQVPKYMNLYLGMADQPARIDLENESHMPGSCYVQFPAMAPQW
jgi:hypothetical protein